jgi:hypothetical protein
VLEDMQDVDFTKPKAAVAAGVPLFRLNNVENFRLRDSAQLPDMHLDHASEKEILPA